MNGSDAVINSKHDKGFLQRQSPFEFRADWSWFVIWHTLSLSSQLLIGSDFVFIVILSSSIVSSPCSMIFDCFVFHPNLRVILYTPSEIVMEIRFNYFEVSFKYLAEFCMRLSVEYIDIWYVTLSISSISFATENGTYTF